MPHIPVVVTPCAVCHGPNDRPYPTCEKAECRATWRRQSKAKSKRERYAYNVARGLCGDCGNKIRKNEKAKNTGTKPIARCAACRAMQSDAKNHERERKRAQTRAEKALEQQIARDARRRKINQERAAEGLPVSTSTNPSLPKRPPKVMEI